MAAVALAAPLAFEAIFAALFPLLALFGSKHSSDALAGLAAEALGFVALLAHDLLDLVALGVGEIQTSGLGQDRRGHQREGENDLLHALLNPLRDEKLRGDTSEAEGLGEVLIAVEAALLIEDEQVALASERHVAVGGDLRVNHLKDLPGLAQVRAALQGEVAALGVAAGLR